jgi:hypothetical protein
MRRHALLDFPRVASVRFPRVRFGPSIRNNQSRVSRDQLRRDETTGTDRRRDDDWLSGSFLVSEQWFRKQSAQRIGRQERKDLSGG